LIDRRSIAIASGILILALACILLVPTSVRASSCSDACKAAYGSCYKSSQDRAKCQAQQQRCLEQCIRSKR
jgi:hypothetical protein